MSTLRLCAPVFMSCESKMERNINKAHNEDNG
jgi:hypothetical protein